MHGVAFMKNTNLGVIKAVPEKIAVIGGGFTAIDCARSSPQGAGRKKRFSIIYPQDSGGDACR